MDETDQYDEWDLSALPMPARSTLYALQPIGMGTPLVESLSSYVTRLAESHCVFSGLLMSKMIVPLVPDYSPLKKQHELFRASGERSTLLNGAGLPALYAVQALETLTRRLDLRSLTLLPLTQALTVRSFFRLTRAWCPACYVEWRATNQPIYDPLLWMLRDVLLCPRHGCLLHTQCPSPDCGRTLPGVAWRARPGYCSYCQRWLGEHREQAQEMSSLKDVAWHHWTAKTLGEVLAHLAGTSVLPDRERTRQTVKYVVEQLTNGNIAALARSLGISVSLMQYWYRGERLPEINTLLHFCYRVDLTLDDFLFEKIENLRPHLRDSTSLTLPTSKKKHAIDPEHIHQALETLVGSNEQPPPTLREAQRRLGYHETILRRIHPAACQGIVTRHKAYVQQRKDARYQQRYQEIMQAVLQLRAEGIAPTRKRIAMCLHHPGILRDPQVRQYVHEICQEGEFKR